MSRNCAEVNTRPNYLEFLDPNKWY